ncbi:MAG: MazG-like family protein [Minisyncoccia bacterium]
MKEYENKIREFLHERKWDNLRPADVAKSIAIEAGELLELFQWTNETLEDVKGNAEKLGEIKKELADVLNYCFDMSVLLDFDTEQILIDKLEKVKQKYPAHLFNGRDENVDAGSEEIYWKIKKEHRAKGG